MVEYVIDALRNHPELTIFLTLAVGFSIGKLRFGSFSLGTVVGTLLAGVVIGQLHIKVDPVVKNASSICSSSRSATRSGRSFFAG
jgi:putative transport protein